MLQYELTIVDENGKCIEYIGTMESEMELENWAKENKGTLKIYEGRHWKQIKEE